MAATKTLITQAEYETLAAFRRTLRQFLHFSENAARAAGVTPQQHQALLVVRGFPGPEPVTIADFAERLQIRHHSAVGLVDRLVKERLVKRTQHDKDHRRIQVSLTAHGGKVLEKLSSLHKEQLLHLMPRLSASLQHLSSKR
jgi:DNA-binding MarR family transcriptional regulator